MNVTPPNPRDTACTGVADLLSRVGARWTAQIIVVLTTRPYRFNELRRAVAGISQQTLARVLTSLEHEGLVDRRVLAGKPPMVEYRITPLGRSLADAMHPLAQWAVEHRADAPTRPDR